MAERILPKARGRHRATINLTRDHAIAVLNQHEDTIITEAIGMVPLRGAGGEHAFVTDDEA